MVALQWHLPLLLPLLVNDPRQFSTYKHINIPLDSIWGPRRSYNWAFRSNWNPIWMRRCKRQPLIASCDHRNLHTLFRGVDFQTYLLSSNQSLREKSRKFNSHFKNYLQNFKVRLTHHLLYQMHQREPSYVLTVNAELTFEIRPIQSFTDERQIQFRSIWRIIGADPDEKKGFESRNFRFFFPTSCGWHRLLISRLMDGCRLIYLQC